MKEKENFMTEMDFPHRRVAKQNENSGSSIEANLPNMVDNPNTARITQALVAL